jgi:hypothetical protein
VCELMLGYPRTAELTADSMVQCLMVPTATFKHLVETMPGVYTRAWQATAAQLAAQHHHILGNHKQLAPLNMFFRLATFVPVDAVWQRASPDGLAVEVVRETAVVPHNPHICVDLLVCIKTCLC